MARVKEGGIGRMAATKISRPNVHAKTKTSKSKTSKNYKKGYGGQGR